MMSKNVRGNKKAEEMNPREFWRVLARRVVNTHEDSVKYGCF